MDPAVLREDMVDGLEHEAKAVLDSEAVAAAMREVPREEFLEDERSAYADRDHDRLGTRVLSPSDAARLLQALSPRPGDAVLVVGAGVGYTVALAAEIAGARNVHAVEIARPVVYEARENLARAGYREVLVDCRDGARGLPEYAPFDRILIEAATVDPPRALVDQLADGGRLVYPRGPGRGSQRLRRVEGRGRGSGTDEGARISLSPLLVSGEQSGAIERNRTAREDVEHARRRAESRTGWEHDWLDWES